MVRVDRVCSGGVEGQKFIFHRYLCIERFLYFGV